MRWYLLHQLWSTGWNQKYLYAYPLKTCYGLDLVPRCKPSTFQPISNVALWLEWSLMVRWVIGSILHGVDPLSYFSFQPVLHDWCNKGCGMCYPVCGMMLLIRKSRPCGGSRFPLSLSEWSFTIYQTTYNRKIKCVECVVK